MFAFIDVWANQELVVKGFITFIHVNKNSKPIPHGIVIEPSQKKIEKLQETAIALTEREIRGNYDH
jgi:hypothetical protein